MWLNQEENVGRQEGLRGIALLNHRNPTFLASLVGRDEGAMFRCGAEIVHNARYTTLCTPIHVS